MVGGVEVYPVRSLLDVIRFVNTGNGISPLKVDSDTLLSEAQHYAIDFKDVRGQHTAKRGVGHIVLAGGLPNASTVTRIKDAGAKLLCFAPALVIAKKLVRMGADAIVIEGMEAGGHTGPVSTGVLANNLGSESMFPWTVC